MLRFTTYSSEETKALGFILGQSVLSEKREQALVMALNGDLGAGKTTFIQGFFKGLNIKKSPMSPTFILMRRSRVKAKNFNNIFHMDAYRLKNLKDLEVLGFTSILADPRNILLVEWADNIKKALPKDALHIKFMHRKNENERNISFT